MEVGTDKNDAPYIGDLNQDRICEYWATKSDKENSYQFMCGKYTSLDVTTTGVDQKTITGLDKIDSDLNKFSLVDNNQEGFGSYKNFFKTAGQENLGIDEATYKEVFTTILKGKEKDTKDLVRVKYMKDGKFYYAPMHLDISKK